MDAERIMFLLFVQNNIDKLSLTYGRNSVEITQIRKLFKALSSEEYDQLNYTKELKGNDSLLHSDAGIGLQDKIELISDKLDVISRRTRAVAEAFYEHFPIGTLELIVTKVALVEDYKLHKFSLKKEDHKLAAKYIIRQIETLLNLFKEDLFRYEEENSDRDGSQLHNIKTYKNVKTMSFNSQLYSIRSYKSIKYIPYSDINTLYDVRNYECHGHNQKELEKNESALNKLIRDSDKYYSAGFELIKTLCSAIDYKA